MTRTEYIAQLNKYLRGLSDEEKMDVLQYYNEIFDEAGISEEMKVPESYEDPKKIALDILTDMNLEFKGNEIDQEYKRKDNTLMILVLAVLAAPIALPIIVALVSALIAVGAVAVSLLVAAGATVVYVFLTDINMMTRAFFIGGVFAAAGAAILLIELIRFIAVAIGREVSVRLGRRSQ